SAHADPCFHEGPDQPRPDRALVINSIARGRIADIPPGVARFSSRERSQADRSDETALHEIDNTTRTATIEEANRQSADSEYLIWPARVVPRAVHVIDVHDVGKAAGPFVKEARDEGRTAPLVDVVPMRFES